MLRKKVAQLFKKSKNLFKKQRKKGRKRKIIFELVLVWHLFFSSQSGLAVNKNVISETAKIRPLLFDEENYVQSLKNQKLTAKQQRKIETNKVVLTKWPPSADGFHHPTHIRLRGSNHRPSPSVHIARSQGLFPIQINPVTKVDPGGLNMGRGDKGQCSKPKPSSFDLSYEYKKLIKDLGKKGLELECSEQRFRDLAINPQKGKVDQTSLGETQARLYGEAKGYYTNLRRPLSKGVCLDFEISNSAEGYIHLDIKQPINIEKFGKERNINVSNYPDEKTVAFNIGRDLVGQKKRFCHFEEGPENPSNVLHIIDLNKIADDKKPEMMSALLNGAEMKGSDGSGILFINYENK